VGGIPPRPSRSEAPPTLLVQSRTQQKSFLFLLEEKIGRAQIKKCEENFFAGWRASASGGGAERQSSQSGFSSKKVRILTKRHRQNWKSESEAEMRSALRADLISACPIRISIFNHLDFARNNFELCPEHTSRFPSLNRSVCKAF